MLKINLLPVREARRAADLRQYFMQILLVVIVVGGGYAGENGVGYLRDHGIEVEAGHVYVIPPNASLSLRGRCLQVAPREASHRPPRPIDLFLSSLAEEHEGLAIGVILSGAGADGTAGEPAAFAATPATESMPRFSPDGRFVAYISDESGRVEVYVRPFPDGAGRWQASVDGGSQPRWRRAS